MHALTATPTTPVRNLHPPRRRGPSAIARHVAVDLTPQTIEQIATRVATLVHRQQQNREQGQGHAEEQLGMMTVSQLASYLKLNPTWVYEHADELGAIRIGKGPKARIRLDLQTAKAALREHHKTPRGANGAA